MKQGCYLEAFLNSSWNDNARDFNTKAGDFYEAYDSGVTGNSIYKLKFDSILCLLVLLEYINYTCIFTIISDLSK